MNYVGWFVLAAVVVGYMIDVVTTWLNIRSLAPAMPDRLDGIYDVDEYRRSQEYTRVRSRLGLLSSSVSLVVLLVFWFAGGFAIVNDWVLSFELGIVPTGVAYIFTLAALSSVAGLPFSLYSTFGIERRFGFNKTTAATFVLDRIKGIALGILIGAPLLALVIWFFANAGSMAWLFCWIALTAFSLVMQYLAPTLIMPLFNKFEALPDGDLRSGILGYANRVDFPLQNVFIMDGSKRSAKSNAFFTGLGKKKRVVLFDTLVDNHTPEQIIAIVAHEVGHYKHKHITKSLAISIVHSGLMLYLLSLMLTSPLLHEAFFVGEPAIHTGLIFFGMLFGPVESILSIGLNSLSRRHEYQADNFAKETTGSAKDMVEALIELATHNLSNLTPHPFHVWMNYSHPPILARIKALENS